MTRTPSLPIEHGTPLAPLTTLGVGGPARHYVRAGDADTVAAAATFARENTLPVFVLGGGSNLVVADEGYAGLVLHVDMRGEEAAREADTVLLTVGGGEDWDGVVDRAVARGWAGIECLSGIPGRVGATPVQNVGAYGQDVSETIERVDGVDLASGTTVSLPGADCGFAYRDSRFKRSDAGRFVITGVTFRLRPGGAPSVRYAELARTLQERGLAAPSLADVRAAVLDLRRGKSMVIATDDPNRRSVGSFFVNPSVTAGEADALRGRVPDGAAMPAFPAPDGRVKLSAAWLIERAGLARGFGEGPVGLSTRHTLAIVNRGGATAAQVIAFARLVRDRVRDRFGVALRPEPVLLGLDLESA